MRVSHAWPAGRLVTFRKLFGRLAALPVKSTIDTLPTVILCMSIQPSSQCRKFTPPIIETEDTHHPPRSARLVLPVHHLCAEINSLPKFQRTQHSTTSTNFLSPEIAVHSNLQIVPTKCRYPRNTLNATCLFSTHLPMPFPLLFLATRC